MKYQLNEDYARQEVRDQILAVTTAGETRDTLLTRLAGLSNAGVSHVVWYILSMNESEKGVNPGMLERFLESSAHISTENSVADTNLEAI